MVAGRSLFVLALLGASAVPAAAEPSTFGGHQLGEHAAHATDVTVTLFGCKGELTTTVEKKAIVGFQFSPSGDGDGCALGDDLALPAALIARISKEMGGAPVGDGNLLWEGAHAAVVMTTHDEGDSGFLELFVAPAGDGTKRVCFSDDGFAAFFASFQKAVATAKSSAELAPFFRFPFVDNVGIYGSSKNVAAFRKRWRKLFDKINRASIAGDDPFCSYEDQRYIVHLYDAAQSGFLVATRVDGDWRFVSVDPVHYD